MLVDAIDGLEAKLLGHRPPGQPSLLPRAARRGWLYPSPDGARGCGYAGEAGHIGRSPVAMRPSSARARPPHLHGRAAPDLGYWIGLAFQSALSVPATFRVRFQLEPAPGAALLFGQPSDFSRYMLIGPVSCEPATTPDRSVQQPPSGPFAGPVPGWSPRCRCASPGRAADVEAGTMTRCRSRRTTHPRKNQRNHRRPALAPIPRAAVCFVRSRDQRGRTAVLRPARRHEGICQRQGFALRNIDLVIPHDFVFLVAVQRAEFDPDQAAPFHRDGWRPRAADHARRRQPTRFAAGAEVRRRVRIIFRTSSCCGRAQSGENMASRSRWPGRPAGGSASGPTTCSR